MVAEQEERVARLQAKGVEMALPEVTLRALEANLSRFQNHRVGRTAKHEIR
jgi:hypothetical protein